MKGIQRLRLALGAMEHSMVPLAAASYAYKTREPKNLPGLEQLLLEHLADVEDCLAHVRMMRLAAPAQKMTVDA
jgi:hypothetical protein